MTTRWLAKARDSLLGLCFPPACAACGTECELPITAPLCSECRERIAANYHQPCPCCAAPNMSGPRCLECQHRQHRFISAVAVGKHEGLLRRLVLRAQAGYDDALALALGQTIAERVLAAQPTLPYDALIPTPMPRLRRLARRANLAETLAEAVARHVRLPVLSGVLRFCRYVRPQHALKAAQRQRNLRQALTTTSLYDITGARLLVIDDVLTTGATADEMARALVAGGASSVSVAVVSRGGDYD